MHEYLHSLAVNGVAYDVYGCWDECTPENEYDFYDVYESSSKDDCINLGDPFYELPTASSIEAYLGLVAAAC